MNPNRFSACEVNRGVGRRTLLGTALAAAISAASNRNASAAEPAGIPEAGPVRASRPTSPYRVWFAPRLFDRDLDLYAKMTIDAGGWLDPRLAHFAGKTALGWVYGLNHPDATGPAYWSDACSEAARSSPRGQPNGKFISAGIAIDEWVPPHNPKNERWLVDGLREGKRSNPELFIAVWTTDSTPPLFQLATDGVVDLIIVEGYTHSAAESGPGLTTSWDGALRRCTTLADAGLESKTILCFGHITARPDARGKYLAPNWLRDRAAEIKHRFPKMPGIAFYQHTAEDTPEFRELVRFCDRLSGELWPGSAQH